jgi:hypothetical protein
MTKKKKGKISKTQHRKRKTKKQEPRYKLGEPMPLPKIA